MWCRYFNKTLTCLILMIFMLGSSIAQRYPLVWQAPSENPYFIGRGDVLDDIENILEKSFVKIAVITGAQGFGKTQTVKKYVYQNFAKYDIVWWFRANQYLQPQFENFALDIAPYLKIDPQSLKDIGPESLVRLIKEKIRQLNLKCLIIFDDATSYSDIEQYLLFSHENNIHTLVTSKNGNFSESPIKIKPFSLENSISYLDNFLPKESHELKVQLAERLGNCPAAISQSIDYIKNYPGMTIKKYLELHSAKKTALLPRYISSKKLGGSMDEYEKDLIAATQMNLADLKDQSPEAYNLLGLMSLFYRDEIHFEYLEKWHHLKGIKTDLMALMDTINNYSFIEITSEKTNKGTYITMQELIQSTITSLLPKDDSCRLIDEGIDTIKETFGDRSDENAATILNDNRPLLNLIRLSHEAHHLDHHTPELMSMRIRGLDILIGMLRDFPNAEKIIEHLETDLQKNVFVSTGDKVLYLVNMALYSAIRNPNYEKALDYGVQSLTLSEKVPERNDERLRILSNLIQHSCLCGLIKNCPKYIEMADKLYEKAQFPAYKGLYLIAKNVYLIDTGDFEGVIKSVNDHRDIIEHRKDFPYMKYFILNQLAEALIKTGKISEAEKPLEEAIKYARDYHGENEQNMFFGKYYVLKGMCLLKDKSNTNQARELMEKGVEILGGRFGASNKHKLQGFGHLQLAKLYHKDNRLAEAKDHYMQSEMVFDSILKEKAIDDVCDLYKQLVILGVDMKDERLTHDYLNKLKKVFGINHPGTIGAITHLDERGIQLPF